MTATSPRWTAEHDGYASLDPPALHRRSVLLDRASRSIDIIDEIEGGSHDVRLAFHLGPEVQVELDGSLRGPAAGRTASTPGAARLELPPGLRWSLHRGETDPILGWYSPGLGRRVPAFTLLGSGRCAPGRSARHAAGIPRSRQIAECPRFPRGHTWCASEARPGDWPGDASGDQMSQQALDLRRSVQIVRRHKMLVSAVTALGILAGGAYATLRPAAAHAARRWSCSRNPRRQPQARQHRRQSRSLHGNPRP